METEYTGPQDLGHPVKAVSVYEDFVNVFRRFITLLGDDPDREGLEKTPNRWMHAMTEMTSGYWQSEDDLFKARFSEPCNEIVVLKGIRFASLCEHHFLPFIGTMTIAYLPKEYVLGISKLARVAAIYSNRFQIQERLGRQIAESVMQGLNPQGVAVIIRAHHQCMGCRGVKQPDAEMLTSCMLGVFLTDKAARQELLNLAG